MIKINPIMFWHTLTVSWWWDSATFYSWLSDLVSSSLLIDYQLMIGWKFLIQSVENNEIFII